MTRLIKSISLPVELNDIINNNITDFSNYVQECIERDFIDEEMINKKIKEYEQKIEELKKLIPNIKKEDKEIETMTKIEKIFLNNAKEIVERNPEFLFGQWSKYKNDYGRIITLNKFKELIE
ncbi:MAG: hypothetical protein WC758_07890 [Candidatus Woesearchaeota archaeon]|jgi:hypothetical protein